MTPAPEPVSVPEPVSKLEIVPEPVKESVPAPIPLVIPDASRVESAKPDLPYSPEQSESDMMFDTINHLVDSGQKEDAIKYLRMVAFYETDAESVQKAERLLAQLQPKEQEMKA